MSVVTVIRAGLSTTIQDPGRPGLRHYGIPVGGAMDRLSHELANRLVGNPPELATLEMTLSGDELEWQDDALVAITGADMSPVVSSAAMYGMSAPLQRPVAVQAGTRIRFQAARRGCRCYVAIAGGFDVPLVMGSRATYLRARIGGLHGRALRTGDELEIGPSSPNISVFRASPGDTSPIAGAQWFVCLRELPNSSETELKVLRGRHFNQLTSHSQSDFWHERFQVSSQSDRMGYRLTGKNLQRPSGGDLLSEGTAIGTVQLPPDGDPILLMSDSAPTGGYPQIAQIITADQPLAAQLRPGDSVRFSETTIEHAQYLARQQRAEFDRAMVMASLLKAQP